MTERTGEMMFEQLEAVCSRPEPFSVYTAPELWTDEYTSAQMLSYHLNGEVELSSRRTSFIDESVEWISGRFGVNEDTSIADFGCGPGLYTSRLARLGAKVTGIDFSKRSLEYARAAAAKENLAVDYVYQNYLEFETDERFDLVLMIMCDFSVLSPSQRETMLRKFRRMLKPGGSVLLDVQSLGTFDQREEFATYELNSLNGFWSPERYYGFLNTFKYDREKVVLDKYTIVEPNRIRTVYNWFQCFSPESLQAEFQEAGLEVETVYGDVAGSDFDSEGDEFAVVGERD